MTAYAKTIIALALALAGFAGGWAVQGWRKDSAIAEQKTEMATLREQAAIQLSQATLQARRTTEALQAAADEQRKADNEEIHTLSTRAGTLARRVRDAEARAATATLVSQSLTPGAGQAPARCDGAGVFGSLGEPDVWEAERADTLRIALKSCYADYDRARAQAGE